MKKVDRIKFISSEYKAFLEFWKERLALLEHGFFIGSNNSFERIVTEKKEQKFYVEKNTAERIIKLVNGNDLGIFASLLTGFYGLLSRYTNEECIVIDTPLYNPENGGELYIDKVSLIQKVEGKKSLKELLIAMQKTLQGSYHYQNFPLLSVLENPLSENEKWTNVATVYRSIHSDSLIEQSYDLVLGIERKQDELSITFRYNDNQYNDWFIQNLGKHYLTILDAFSELDTPLMDINILSVPEQDQLIKGFNDTNCGYPAKLIHELFEEQVLKAPDNVALVIDDKKISYKELNERSNQLAHVLRSIHQIKQNDIVGLMLDRSEWMLISILAVLKAGGTYLPIDPDYPHDRIQYTLEDSGCKLLITSDGLTKDLSADLTIQKVEDKNILEKPISNLVNINQPADCCYIIYTSGSTGRPKGVMISHHNVVRLLFNEKIQFDFNDKDTWSLFHSYCFDFSVWEMYGALLYGGKLVIVPKVVAQNPKEFVELVSKEGVTILNQTPGAFYNFIEAEQERGKQDLKLRHIIFGGEALHPSRLKNWKVRYPNVKLINMYGITETTVHVTYKEIAEKEIAEGISNIGVPIPTLTCYVLDKHQQLQPIGVAGELCVGGEGLSSGYLNREELTKERFIVHPFMEGEKLYRSGDLARWLPNGELEYLGRIDHQVKIRGFRIELGEIEKVLDSHPEIKQAVVIDKEDKNGEKFLCAYIVNENGTILTTSQLREFLLIQLPDYMVPRYFVNLEKIPLTVNGKVSRKELPLPEGEIQTGAEFIAARTVTEETLTGIWNEVLGLEKIGVKDNFFDLGGHSLKATQALASIQKAMFVDISLTAFFNNPTIESIANYIATVPERSYTTIELSEDKPYYPLTAAQKRMFILHKFNESGIAYNMPGALQVNGNVDVDLMEQAFIKLIQRQESLRTSFDFAEDEPVQIIHDSVVFKIEKHLAEEDKIASVISSFVKPFDLSVAPLFRVGLINIAPEKHILLFDMHHIISDGVSMEIFVKEFVSLYKGDVLSPLELRYRDFSEWQQNSINSDKIGKQEKYWLSQFEGEMPVLNLPTDFSRPSIQQFDGKRFYFDLEQELTLKLKLLTRETGTTLFQFLLATYNVLLSKYSGQEDIVVGTPVAGRSVSGLEQTIGIFINTLALRNYPESNKVFHTFLNEVRETVLQGIEHQDYQFEVLIEKLNVKRDTSRSPIFDTLFTFTEGEKDHLSIGSLDIQPYPIENNTSQFDISLNGVEVENKISFCVEYCTRLFRQETIERFSNHFMSILNSITNDLNIEIASLNLVTADELTLLSQFNATEKRYRENITVISLFEEQVSKSPDSVALIFENETMSYRTLNAKANQLARFLTSKGVCPESIVGLMVEPSFEMMVTLFAILKAGAAYLPIDVNYPEERISNMLQDSNSKLLLVSKKVNNVFSQVECINVADENCYDENATDLGIDIKPNNLAYVLYTSGSTGQPKGVMIEHENLVDYVQTFINLIGVNSNDVTLQNSSTSFDTSIEEFFPALCVSGKVLINRNNKDFGKIVDWIEKGNITILNTSPLVLNFINEETESFGKLRAIISGGDVLKPSYISNIINKVKVYNSYGPTESTVCVTYHEVEDTNENISIGKPIANRQVYILDTHLNLLPIGIIGELCVGGKGIARGYLNREDLTNEKFVDNPFVTAERIYKTGDLAKWLPDGTIEFVGRIDHQVKIRGFRIELGEIENQLVKHPLIDKAVVIDRMRKDEGDKYLCAYIATKEELLLVDIRSFLEKELPEYMIPSVFISLEDIPVTANGKIDRKKLLEINPGENMMSASEYVEPFTDVEKRLVAIWTQILGIEKIGIKDNFFELGGNSIKIIKMLRLIDQDYPGIIQIGNLYDSPTIEQLAVLIANADGQKEKQEENLLRIVEF